MPAVALTPGPHGVNSVVAAFVWPAGRPKRPAVPPFLRTILATALPIPLVPPTTISFFPPNSSSTVSVLSSYWKRPDRPLPVAVNPFSPIARGHHAPTDLRHRTPPFLCQFQSDP